jgi:hypothetical protein
MVDIQSKEVIDKISEDLKIQPSLQVPRELAKAIQLIYNVNPTREVQIRNKVAADSVSEVIHTTHATKRTFLIAVSLSVAKDIVSPSVRSRISLFPKGKAVIDVIELRYEPLTAGDYVESLSLPIPMELEKNSEIKVLNQSATASIDAAAKIYFFEVDPQ